MKLFLKILPREDAERLFKSTLWLTNILFYVFYPFVRILVAFADFVVCPYYREQPHESCSEWVSSELEIQFLIDYIHERGLIESEKTEMLQNIFDLGKTPVKDIMVPATDIISVNVKATIKETLAIFI